MKLTNLQLIVNISRAALGMQQGTDNIVEVNNNTNVLISINGKIFMIEGASSINGNLVLEAGDEVEI